MELYGLAYKLIAIYFLQGKKKDVNKGGRADLQVAQNFQSTGGCAFTD